MRIAILGTGSWGTALAVQLAQKNHLVCMWSAFPQEIAEMKKERKNKLLPQAVLPESVDLTDNLEQSVQDADFILIAVPSHVVKLVCTQLKPFYKNQIVICVAKGFDENTLERLTVVISNTLETENTVLLTGPTHAEEVAIGLPTAIVSSCEDIKKAEIVQDLFISPMFRVYTNTDVIGAEVSGALKNVIALCAGISDGSGFGDNTKAALMTRGMAEIIRLGIAMGGRADTFSGLTGIGDLIVTCTSMHSRNRRAGILIGKGKSLEEALSEVGMVVEGVKSCKEAFALSKKHNVEMPIVETAYAVLYEGKSAKEAVSELMMRKKKEE